MDKQEIYNSHKAWVIAQTEIMTEDFAQKMILSADKVQGFFGIKDEILYIAFQGSADFRDILSDIDILMVDLYSGSKIHFGFYKQFKIIEEYIDKLINPITDVEKSVNSAQRVIFSGQSLGGSIAIIASYIFKTKYPLMNISCVTFGCPKVGNQAFTVNFAQKNVEIKQYIYKNDIVPKLPFRLFGYRETSKAIHFGDYKWHEYFFYPFTKIFGNPFNHLPKHYIEEFIL